MASEPRGNRLLQYFEDYTNYGGTEYDIRRAIAQLADQMNNDLPPGPEKTTGLRKLMEAQDCFLRADKDNTV